MIVVVTACTITLTAAMETSVSGVQLVEAASVDEAVDLKVRVPRGLLSVASVAAAAISGCCCCCARGRCGLLCEASRASVLLPLLLLLSVAAAVVAVGVERWLLLLPMRPLLLRVHIIFHSRQDEKCSLDCVTTADCVAFLLS